MWAFFVFLVVVGAGIDLVSAHDTGACGCGVFGAVVGACDGLVFGGESPVSEWVNE